MKAFAYFSLRGHVERCRILRRHPAGTYDVQRLSDGRCFRVTGLPIGKPPAKGAP